MSVKDEMIASVELAISQAAYPDVHPDFTDAAWRRMAVAAIQEVAKHCRVECPANNATRCLLGRTDIEFRKDAK